ncbi:complement factor H isoform X4 [Phaenicophaeus curvirostris]|uniref:complement factor H isoform X4 n=1 Tax=Phaenicophaeus curvirostris TaxID=33595 RepID=UPI0037F0DC4E
MSFLGYTALLLCWMYCSAERACKEPPPRRVKEVPTDIWDKPPYPHGTQVTYRCRPGYIKIGRIVFECADGAWTQHLPGAECRNKPCGHPGDIEFGSFELTSGSEFVFGARVEYSCNDGYQMLSQRNYRECQADGWSNDIPHCEVAKCLPVQAPENGRIIVTGAFELGQEYSFGQVINFECKAKYRLVGSKEIICSSNGKWDSDVPQCQEIICDVPKIEHGFVLSQKKSYKESEQLQFGCDEGYVYKERANVQCTESGWNPTPYCTEIVCSPPRVPNGSFRPEEDRYVVGGIITIQCNPGYHFKTLTGKTTSECTKNGWVPDPGCVQKPCDYPVIENGMLSRSVEYYRNYYFPMRFGQHIHYHCNRGYSSPQGEGWVTSVCSEMGWTPEPKCLKNCEVKHLENGYFLHNHKYVYKEGERVKYRCNIDYHTEHEDGEVTCTKNDWSPPPRCVRKKKCQNIYFDNGYSTSGKNTFNLQEEVTYRCHTGFVTVEGQETGVIQCQENGWTPSPKCIKSCEKPHCEILNYHANKTVFMPEDTIEYACLEGYQTANNMPTGTTRCGIDGQWSPVPKCLAIECEMLTLPNGDFSPKEGKYRNGDVVKFTCANNYVRVGPASTQCYYFGWFPSPPVCKVNARGCGPPPEVTNASVLGGSVEQYRHGDRKEYECNIEFKLVGSKEIECVEGQWSPPPSCIEDKMPCGSPSSIPNVVLHQEDQTEFLHGDEVLCGCKQDSGNSRKMKIKCLNGEWKPLPLCADPSPQCVLPTHVRLVRNTRLHKTKKEAEFHGVISYRCTSADKSVKEAACVSGKWSPEIECTAEETTCPPPPQVPGAQQITVGRKYKHGSKIAFSCLESFQLIGLNEITCIEGKWQSPPYCLDVTCEPPPEIAGGKVQGVKKSRYMPGENARYQCWRGFEMTGAPTVVCQNGTWTEQPKCKGKGGKCGPPPVIENGDLLSFPMQEYAAGATLRYKCPSLYTLEGSESITCTDGQWTNPPVCLVACTASEEDMNRNNIELKWTFTKKLYSRSGDFIEFRCKRGYVADPASLSFRVQCIQGKLEYPRCKPGKNCTICEESLERNKIRLQSSRWMRTYLSGDYISFECQWRHRQVSRPETFSARCVDGVINYPMCQR